MTLRLHIQADTRATLADFKAIRKQVNRTVKAALKEQGERWVLPLARARAWTPVKGRIVVRSSSRSAWLTTSGATRPWGNIAGLMEFGGTVHTVIRPRSGAAVLTPLGPRAAVKKPRHYAPRGILQAAVRERFAPYEAGVVDAVETMITEGLQ